MNGAKVLIQFVGDTKDVNNKVNGLSKSMGGLTKSFVFGNLISKGISTAFNMISSSAGSAIKRLDTMNNFPKVMSNLGISTKDSQKAINTLSDKLQGLPTSIDTAAASVQRFTSKNGNIKKSTDLFLAMNNAILAGGAPAEQQASAMEQLSQAYAKGKPDMMEWRAIQSVMPAQLKQIATQMGYAGGNADKLGEDLRSGKVSMDDFMNAVTDLNKNGGKNFKSFEEQARNSTGGIQTAIANMKTAITRGLANAFDSLDKSLKSSGLGGISGVISSIGKGFESVLKAIVPLIPPIIKALVSIFNWMKKHQQLIKVLAIGITGFIVAFKAISIIIGIINAIKTALMALKVIMIVVNAVMMANPIGLIIAAIAALIAIFVLLWKKCAWFRNFWIGLWEGIKSVFSAVWNALKTAFKAVVNWVKNNWKQILLFLVNPFAGAFAYLYKHSAKFRNFINKFVAAVVGFFKSFPQKIKELPGKVWTILKNVIFKVIEWRNKLRQKAKEAVVSMFNTIVNKVKQLPSKMLHIGIDIAKGIGNGITKGVTWIKNKLKELVGNVTKFIKKVFKIGSPSKLMADEVGQWLPKGIAVGFDANTDAIYSSMSNLQKDMNKMIGNTFGLSPSLTGTASTHLSPNINNTIIVNVKQDPLGQMVKDIKTFSGGAKNDYNYGMGA